jgi:hypothetical protein
MRKTLYQLSHIFSPVAEATLGLVKYSQTLHPQHGVGTNPGVNHEEEACPDIGKWVGR